MKRIMMVSSAFLLLALLFVPCVGSKGAPRNDIADGNTAMAVQLYRELGAEKGNLFFSPYSISSALGMTYAGARGNTAKEMREALHFQLEQAALNSAFRDLNRELAATAHRSGQKLNIANALVLTGGNVSGEFRAILKDYYDAEFFSGGLDVINGWVKKKTEGKIDRILDELSANSVCVLLNAIYFKGAWEAQFEKKNTHDAPFHLLANKQVKVPLMYRKGDLKILEEGDLQVISLPYKGKSLSMVILLPKTVDGLGALEGQLTAGKLTGWLAKLDKQPDRKVSLYLPRFKLETGYDLGSPFQKMGMKDAFSPAADFSGMGWPKGRLWIGQIKHKAFVEVNEEGTEAAAATAVEMVTKSMAPRELVFRADHPFFFVVRDNRTGAVLFMGRLTDPTGK
ncbi:MAG TPA: serpin family protein [Syntrophorhabdaceae bacterium]|nr:serpin family protein [Syntrophorhabdaceae bacterium]